MLMAANQNQEITKQRVANPAAKKQQGDTIKSLSNEKPKKYTEKNTTQNVKDKTNPSRYKKLNFVLSM